MYHFGMQDVDVHQLPRELEVLYQAWESIQAIFDLPEINEQEIVDRGIPTGLMYNSFRGMLNNVPVCGRLIQTREGQDFVVDVRYDTARLHRHQQIIEQIIGRLTIMRNYNEE